MKKGKWTTAKGRWSGSETGKYPRCRLFVLTLGYSRKSVRLLVWQSSAQTWAELHERAFRRLGGTVRVIVLDNLKEGVLTPDVYDPALNPLYRDVLAHYGVVGLPCRVGDKDDEISLPRIGMGARSSRLDRRVARGSIPELLGALRVAVGRSEVRGVRFGAMKTDSWRGRREECNLLPLARAILSARSKALWLALVRSIAHRICRDRAHSMIS